MVQRVPMSTHPGRAPPGVRMRRSTLLIVVAIFAISGVAVSQVVVANQGYATMQEAAVAENIAYSAGDISSRNPSAMADDGIDLVAVAMAFKTRTPNTQRIYTNDDIHRLDQMPNSDISTVPLQPETLDQNLGSTASP